MSAVRGTTYVHWAAGKPDITDLANILRLPGISVLVDLLNDDAETALTIAIRENRADKVSILLQAGASPNAGVGMRAALPPLVLAAETASAAVILLLLGAGAPVNAVDGQGLTSLIIAASFGRLDICRILLDASADVNVRGTYGASALLSAVRGRSLAVCRLLLGVHGVDAESVDMYCRSPLTEALHLGELEIVRLLLGYVDANVNDGNRESAMYVALDFEKDQKVFPLLKLLLEHAEGLDVNANIWETGDTPLFFALFVHNNLAQAAVLLAHPTINPNALTIEQNDPLLVKAVEEGNGDFVDLLLAHSAIDVNLRGQFFHALGMASYKGSVGILERLLAASGIDVNALDINGTSALGTAVYYRHVDIIKRLLAVVDVNMAEFPNRHPLILSSRVDKYRLYQANDMEIQVLLLNSPGIQIDAFLRASLENRGFGIACFVRAWYGRLDFRGMGLTDKNVKNLCLAIDMYDVALVDVRSNAPLTERSVKYLKEAARRNPELVVVRADFVEAGLSRSVKKNQDLYMYASSKCLSELRGLMPPLTREQTAHIGAIRYPLRFVPNGPNLFQRAYDLLFSLLENQNPNHQSVIKIRKIYEN
jgi:ankyrin repeat protein